MLQVLGSLRRRRRHEEQQQPHDRAILVACSLRPKTQSKKLSLSSSSSCQGRSVGDVSKITVETTSSIDGGDSRSVSSGDEERSSNSSTGHSEHAADYGLPSIYSTPGFQEEYQRNSMGQAKSFVSVPTLVRNTSRVLSALRNEIQATVTNRTGKEKDVEWWNFDTIPLTANENAQEEEEQIAFYDNRANDLPVDAGSGEHEDADEDGSDFFDNTQRDAFDFMMYPFACHGNNGKALRSPLLLTAVSEEELDEQDESPRLGKNRLVGHKHDLSRRRSNAVPSSTGVLGACAQLVTVNDTMLSVERSVQHLKFMSPEDFDALENATINATSAKDFVTPTSCSLSSMVHTVDAKHFKQERTPKKSSCSVSVVSKRTIASASSESTEVSSVLNIDRYAIKNRQESVRKRLSSAFRSNSSKKNVSYSLLKGKNGMSKQERAYASTLLPSKPLLSKKERTMTSSVIPRPIPHLFDQPLSILLLNTVLKIFEIVLVDFFRDTTIGDALSKARSAATDDSLAGQKYVSLCNRKLELAAPMLPVSLLVHTARDQDPDRPLTSSEKRKLMEQRLLVAVPAGSSAKDCQHIRRVLWKNPRVQRWWSRSDPFSHPDVSGEDDDDDALYDAADLVTEQPQPVKPVSVQCSRRHRHRNVRYQCLDDDEK